MHDEIIEHLRIEPLTSREIAEKFLRFKNPPQALAHAAVCGILQKDSRCFVNDLGLWEAQQTKETQTGQRLGVVPFVIVNLTSDPGNARRIVHISIWKISPEIECLLSAWLSDPSLLPLDEQDLARDGLDRVWNPDASDQTYSDSAEILVAYVPIFIGATQQAQFAWICAERGEIINDTGWLLSHFLRCCTISVPRPITLDECYKTVFGRFPRATSVARKGEQAAEIIAEGIRLLAFRAIETLQDFIAAQEKIPISIDFSAKAFSLEDIKNVPRLPGVYAFLDTASTYIYIGKSKNLRARVLGYFADSDESPVKLQRLREESHSFKTHVCGSDLESIITEFRLIQKHAPTLNKQATVNERRGQFTPIDDCIVVLPCTDSAKCLGLWYRKNQKIKIRYVQGDESDSEDVCKELEEFFLLDKLPAASTDFSLQELVTRYIKRHAQDLEIIPVHRMADAKEMYEATMISYKEASGE